MRLLIDSWAFVPFLFERGSYVANLILKLRHSSVIMLTIYLTENEDKGEMLNAVYVVLK